MKQCLLIVLTIVLLTACKKEDVLPNKPNYAVFTATINASPQSCIKTADGNLVGCGTLENTFVVVRFTMSGSLIWKKQYTVVNGSALAVAEDNNNDLYICGSSYSNAMDIALLKVTGNGDSLWFKNYGENGQDKGVSIIKASDGNMVIGGTSNSYGPLYNNDFYFQKTDTDGNILWKVNYSDYNNQYAEQIIETSDGGYVLTGGTDNQNLSGTSPYFMKTNSAGVKLWSKTHTIANGLRGYTIETANGELVSCQTSITMNGWQIRILKMDNSGNLIWERIIGTLNNSEEAISLLENTDMSYTIIGNSMQQINGGGQDGFLMSLSSSGDSLWCSYMNTLNINLFKIFKEPGGNNLIVGQEYHMQPVEPTMYITRTDANGNFK